MKEIKSQVPEAHHVEFTPEQERKLWRKIDLRILSIISPMFLFSFLDRGNIGNAKLEGMVTQLDLTGNRYNVALTSFFIPYIIFQVPANVVIHYVRPSRWLPLLMLIWGLVMMLMGFVQTYQQLVAVRFCLGLAEAGFYPGVAYYLTMWYPKYKLQYRFALFFGTTAVAGSFSGLLAYSISFMNNAGGLQGWSWIFIMEGLATIVICCIAAIFFVDYPRTAKFLSIEERQFVEQQHFHDVEDAEEGTMVHHLWMTFTDWQVWALSIVLLSFETPGYGILFFLPTILKTFGYSNSASQLLTVPIYAAAATTMFIVAHFSDKMKLRSPFIVGLQAIALVGYAIELSNASAGVKYFGTYLCGIGVIGAFPSVICWLANNLEGKRKRAIGLALQNSVAVVSGIIASNIYRAKDDPRYIFGHAISLGLLAVGFLATLSTAFAYMRIIRNRNTLVEGEKNAQRGPTL